MGDTRGLGCARQEAAAAQLVNLSARTNELQVATSAQPPLLCQLNSGSPASPLTFDCVIALLSATSEQPNGSSEKNDSQTSSRGSNSPAVGLIIVVS